MLHCCWRAVAAECHSFRTHVQQQRLREVVLRHHVGCGHLAQHADNHLVERGVENAVGRQTVGRQTLEGGCCVADIRVRSW